MRIGQANNTGPFMKVPLTGATVGSAFLFPVAQNKFLIPTVVKVLYDKCADDSIRSNFT